jgi:hypothetical protein
MTRIRRVRWFAILVVMATALAIFAIGEQSFASSHYSPCQAGAASTQEAQDKSWRTGGFRSAGCLAWRHLHRHRLYGRTS